MDRRPANKPPRDEISPLPSTPTPLPLPPPLPTPPLPGKPAKRVLIVEDDASTAAEIAAALEDDGFAVESASNGHDGLLLALHGNFHGIVLDRMLGDVDGLSILSTLRNVGIETPVLILSALAAVNERVRGLRAGGDDYLTKPFSFLELTARLNILLWRHRAPATQAALQIGDLQLEATSRRVTRAGTVIELKPREFGLLEYLMKHSGHVVTRAMLLESVWDYHFDANTNVIDVHMGQLRRKISLDGTMSAMIHTVRNQGYILRGQD